MDAMGWTIAQWTTGDRLCGRNAQGHLMMDEIEIPTFQVKGAWFGKEMLKEFHGLC
jgi:hypothetical protein